MPLNLGIFFSKYFMDFTKDTQWEISLKRHLIHLIEYAFVGVSLSISKFIGGEYLNESRNDLHSSIHWFLHHYSTAKKGMS